MARSARRPGVTPSAGPAAPSPAPGLRSWEGIDYRPAEPGARTVRDLFEFAGAWVPPAAAGELAWEARTGGRLVGGALVERDGEHGFVHGPVVVDPPAGAEAIEVAAQLAAAVIDQAQALGLTRLYTRPQGLDRVWVRSGFVPIPEATLPASMRGRPGSGLHCWRRPGTYEIATPDPEGSRGRGRR